MADERFDLIFRGDIVLGQPLAAVKQRLQQLFKADAAKVEKLFSGRPVALKRGLDEATARKYQQVLHKAGAQVTLVASSESGSKPSAQPPKAASGAPSAERPAPEPSAGLSVLPVGGFLLAESERTRLTPVSVDVSALSLRPPEGNLLEQSERLRTEAAPVAVPDFEVAEAGAMLQASDGGELPLVGVEPEDWGLADIGSDLLNADEREAQPVTSLPDPEFEVAPPGSDMGQLKRHTPPVEPDISGLRLED